MAGSRTSAIALVACLAALHAPAPALRAEEPPLPAWQKAMDGAKPLLEIGRKTKPCATTKEGKDAAAAVLSAYALLKPQQKEGLKQEEFQKMWNELITLGWFHGLKAIPTEYQMERSAIAGIPIRFALPVGRGWVFKTSGTRTDQIWGEITKTLPNGRVVRLVRISAYFWTGLYRGIQGSNDKGLAEEGLKADREAFSKVDFRSNEVAKGRAGKGMPKAYVYEILGVDKEFGPARRRCSYVKAEAEVTFGIEAIEIRKPGIEDDAWTDYQTRGEPDRELDAVLDSLEETVKK